MKCTNCGFVVKDSSKPCPSCNYINNSTHNIGYKKGPSWKKVFSIVIILLCLIASGTFAYGVLSGKTPKEAALDFLFWNKSPKELYFQAEFKSFQKDLTSLDGYIGDFWHLQSKMLESPYKNSLEIKGNFDIDGESDLSLAEMHLIKLVLRGSKIVITSEVDPNDSTSYVDAQLKINGTPLLETELFQSKKQTALKIPLIDKRFYYIDNKQFGQFMHNFSQTNYAGSNELFNIVDEQKKYFLTRDDMMEFISEYAKVVNEHLKEDNFSIQNDVLFQGKKQREITMSLSEDEFKNLLINSITRIQNSDKLSNYINAQSYIDSKSKTTDIFKEMKEHITNNLSFPNGFKMKVIIDKNDYIVNRTITVPLSIKDIEKNIEFVYSSTKTKREETKKLDLYELNGDANGLFFEWTSKTAGNEQTNTFDNSLTFKAIQNNEEFEFLLSFAGDVKKENNLKELSTNYSLSMKDSSLGTPFVLMGTLKQTTDQDLKRNYSNNKTELSVTFPLEGQISNVEEVTINLNVSSKTEFTDSVTKLTLTPENSLNAKDLTPYDMLNLFDRFTSEIEALFGNFGL